MVTISNHKPIKRLVKFVFLIRDSRIKRVIILCSALQCTKTSTLRPLAQKGCAPLIYSYPLSSNSWHNDDDGGGDDDDDDDATDTDPDHVFLLW